MADTEISRGRTRVYEMRLVGLLVAARALVWLPGPILFFARRSAILALPRNSLWEHVAIYFRQLSATAGLGLAVAALAVGIGLVAGSKRARRFASFVLWAMLLYEIFLISIAVLDFTFIRTVSGYWLATMGSLAMTLRETVGDIGWTVVLIIFFRSRRDDGSRGFLGAGRFAGVAPMVVLVAMLLVFREGTGITAVGYSLPGLRSSLALGQWQSFSFLSGLMAIAVPVCAILCTASLAIIPRLARPLACATLLFAVLRQGGQLAILAPTARLYTAAGALTVLIPVLMLIEYAAFAMVVARPLPDDEDA